MTLTAADMIARAERLEHFAEGCRREGHIHGPEGAEDCEAAARSWREDAARQQAREEEEHPREAA